VLERHGDGRARIARGAAAHELTTTSVVPFASLSRASTSSAVRISSTRGGSASIRMGVMKRSSYMGALRDFSLNQTLGCRERGRGNRDQR
jgi:hypothetical protein